MRLTYKKKLFSYFFFVFAVFTIIIVMVQQNREKTYKTENLRTSLDAYSEVVAQYIKDKRLFASTNLDSVRFVLPLLPDDLRLTIISRQGNILYDNYLDSLQKEQNHLDRPEITSALINKVGSGIRQSKSTGIDYYYYARFFDNYFVRVALPYNINIQNILEADNIFMYFILLLFFTALISLL